MGVPQGLETSLPAWVGVALPSLGNVGWLLEGDRGEILLPVEEVYRENHPESEGPRLHHTFVSMAYPLYFGDSSFVFAPHHASCLRAFAPPAPPIPRSFSLRVPWLTFSFLRLTSQIISVSKMPCPLCLKEYTPGLSVHLIFITVAIVVTGYIEMCVCVRVLVCVCMHAQLLMW